MVIPDSIRTYLYDGGIRRAVKELVALPENQILEGLAWTELSRFYRAKLAARQLEAEWGIFALELWETVWGGLLDHWAALSPDEQTANKDYEAGVYLASLTDTGDDGLWFGRLFTSGTFIFYACLSGVPSTGLRLKVSCESDNRSIEFAELDAVIDEYKNWGPRLTLPLDSSEIDPTPLRELAAAAVRIADEGIGSRRGKKAS